MDLKAIFGEFVGQPIRVIEEQKTFEGKRLGKVDYTYSSIPESKIVDQLTLTAEKHGLTLRLLTPSTAYTLNQKERRANIHVEKRGDGSWVIANKLELG